MLQQIKRTLVLALVLGATHGAQGFSLLGPLPTHPTAAPQAPSDWQVGALGYDLTGDIGGPMNLGEEYRYNSPTITYAFDQSFLLYFGARGVAAVEEAIAAFNDLPPVSQMSPDLTEFPTENKRLNATAQALQVLDLKSVTMRMMLEILGLAEPERWTWTIRARDVDTIAGVNFTNYFIIQRNFDPVTFQPTNRVNDAFYGYVIDDPIPPDDYADAIEVPLDPLQFSFSSVAGGFLAPGELYTGLTRDDAGGWRYLLRFNNFNVEGLPPQTGLVPGFVPGQPGTPGRPGRPPTGGAFTSPWAPFVGATNVFTNVFGNNFSSPWVIFPPTILPPGGGPIPPGGTNVPPGGTNPANLAINIALRPGVEKITFIRTDFDSIFGQGYTPVTNFYTDLVVSNFTTIPQVLQRINTFPDLLFTAEDLGVPADSVFPFLTARGSVFVNNDTINGNTIAAGPGVITGPMTISFSNILPGQINSSDGFFIDLTGPNPINQTVVWGSFDATPDPIVIYPDSVSIQELEALVLGR